MNAVLAYLKKYSFGILFFGALILLLVYFIPSGEYEYLREELDKLNNYTTNAMLCISVLLAGILFFLSFRSINNLRTFITSVGSSIFFGVFLFFFVRPFVYAALLLLNNVNNTPVEKKYIIGLIDSKGKIFSLYDIAQKKEMYTEHLKYATAISKLYTGDSIVISFNKGILGVNRNPVVMKTMLTRPQNVPITAFRIIGNEGIFWYDVNRVHSHRNNAYINIYDNSNGKLVLGKNFTVICEVIDTLKPLLINRLEEQIKEFDGEKIILKRGNGEDSCWMQ